MYFEVEIIQQMRDEAREYNDKKLKALKDFFGSSKKNYTGLAVKDRFYNGCLAELCFAKALQQFNIPYNQTSSTSNIRYPDNGDFNVFGDIIDIKFVPAYGKLFLHSIAQWQRTADRGITIDTFIPIKINAAETIGIIYGYFTRAEVKAMPLIKNKIVNYTADAEKSHPFDELIQRWRKAQ